MIFFVWHIRGDTFRKDFSHLSEVRSIVPDTVHLMALTATATLSTQKYISPHSNITLYCVGDKPSNGIASSFKAICEALVKNKKMDRTLIFCRSYRDVINIQTNKHNPWRSLARTARFTRLCKVSSCGHVHSLYTLISEEEDYRTIFKRISIKGVNCYWGIWFGHELPRYSPSYSLGSSTGC